MISRHLIIALAAWIAPATAWAQQVERPQPQPRAAKTQEDEARKLFAAGALQQKQGLFLSAKKSIEECVRLDPDAIPPRRLLATLYLALGRPDDALAMAKSVTERDPADYDGWQRYAEHLHDLGKAKEALIALTRATDCESIGKYPQQLFDLLNTLGIWAEKAKDYDAAEKAYRRRLAVLEFNRAPFRVSGFVSDEDYANERFDGFEKIGEACLKSGRHEAALAAFEQARAAFQGRNDILAKARVNRLHWHMAQACSAQGAVRMALTHLNEYLLVAKPAGIEPYRMLVDLSRRLSGPDDAVAALAPLLDRDPNNLRLKLLYAEQLADADRFDQAESVYLKLLEKQIKPEIYLGLFRLHDKHDRMSRALELLDRYLAEVDKDKDKEKVENADETARQHVRAMMAVIAKNPSMLRKMLPLAEQERGQHLRRINFDYRTFERLAALAVHWDDLESAERLLREASNRQNRFTRAGIDFVLLDVLEARRKFADVKALCSDRIAGGDLNRFYYHHYLDLACAKLGEIDAALQANDQALILATSEEHKYMCGSHRAQIFVQAGRFEDAYAECQRILKEFPAPRFSRDTSLRLATVLSHMRRHDEGEKLLRRLLDQDPNDSRVCNYLGYELADRGKNLDEAEKLIRRAIQLDRRAQEAGAEDADAPPFGNDNAAYLDSLAWVLFRKGKLAEARKIQEQAVSQPDGKNSPEEWDHLGDICFKLGENAAAREAWLKAVKLYKEERLGKKDGRQEEAERKLKLVN